MREEAFHLLDCCERVTSISISGTAEDARQTAALAVIERLRRPGALRGGSPADPSVRSLVGRIVARWVGNFVRAGRRHGQHYVSAVDVAAAVEGWAADPGWVRSLRGFRLAGEDDPRVVAERREEAESLAAAVRRLTGEERRLYELWRSGGSRAAIGRRLGVSEKVVSRRLRKLQAKLSAALGVPHR